jgi:hypothetical protein
VLLQKISRLAVMLVRIRSPARVSGLGRSLGGSGIGTRRLAALESAACSFEHATSQVRERTGLALGRRQVEALTVRAAVEFDSFYAELRALLSNNQRTRPPTRDPTRTLGCAWSRIVWRCWQDRVPYELARHRAAQQHVTVSIPSPSGDCVDVPATQRMASDAPLVSARMLRAACARRNLYRQTAEREQAAKSGPSGPERSEPRNSALDGPNALRCFAQHEGGLVRPPELAAQ